MPECQIQLFSLSRIYQKGEVKNLKYYRDGVMEVM